MMPFLSVIVPTLNEESSIEACLRRVSETAPDAEILVPDGGSSDRTLEIARRNARVLCGRRGRGRQLNHGAREAHGEILLFLHADTLLPLAPITEVIRKAMEPPEVIGGNFGVRYRPESAGSRMLERAYRVARPLGIFYGDSAVFVRRAAFLARGGLRQQELMEDVELARWMRRAGRVARVPHLVITSSRRFDGRVPAHLLLWSTLHLLYFCGVPDRVLARLYLSVR